MPGYDHFAQRISHHYGLDHEWVREDVFPPKERWGLHVALAAITIALMSWGHQWLFPVALFSILLAHEMGHYIACKIYGVNASPPYFLPGIPAAVAGLDLAPGTFGAFIRIRQPIPNRRALFDIGIAGPLAGFAVLLLFVPAALQELHPAPVLEAATDTETAFISDPLMFRWLVPLSRGFPYAQSLEGGPLYQAVWIGCLVTMLNLFPIGQLDGGHVAYALFGRKYNRLAIPMLALVWAIVVLTCGSFALMALLVTLIGPWHPPLLREEREIGLGRKALAIVAVVVFVACLNPLMQRIVPAHPSHSPSAQMARCTTQDRFAE